jgi:hypothetical protein
MKRFWLVQKESYFDKELLAYEWVTAGTVLEKVKTSYPYLTNVFHEIIKNI